MKFATSETSRSNWHRRRFGLTLVESIISIVIISVMLVAALDTLGGAARARQLHALQSQDAPLANQLMGEILQARYEEPANGFQTLDDGQGGTTVVAASSPPDTPVFGREPSESGGSRANWDDVDDYDGWSASPPETKDGIALAGYTGWSRQVAVAFVSPNSPNTVMGSDRGLKRITVTVTDPNGQQTTLTALRSKVGAYEHEPAIETTSMTGVVVELQIDPLQPPIVSGTISLNQLSVSGGS